MTSSRGRTAVIIVAALLVGGAASYTYLDLNRARPSCASPLAGSNTLRAVLPPNSFGAVTEFALPGPDRAPNSITVSPDGSAWFGEQNLPGVGHIFSNGTLMEYAWPFNYPSSPQPGGTCSQKTSIWGIVLWGGMVWASDASGSQLVGLSPSSGTFQTVPLTNGSFPYTLAVGPEGDLWFTDLSYPAQIGRVERGTHAVRYYSLPGGANSTSAYLLFENATLAYALSINPSTATGRLFSFDPGSAAPTFLLVGGNQALLSPTSVASGEGGLWLTQHSASSMAFFDTSSRTWTFFPTSTVDYVAVTLPYFDVANGSAVWFNEHYGNKLATICCNRTSLTEYSFSDPPATNGTQIANAISIGLGKGAVWFTEWTADRVGFVNSSYPLPFSLKATGSRTVLLRRGSAATVTLRLGGRSERGLRFQFSDSESYTSVPRNISFSASPVSFPSLNGPASVTVTVRASPQTVLGRYVGVVTVTDGLLYRSVYLEITVEG